MSKTKNVVGRIFIFGAIGAIIGGLLCLESQAAPPWWFGDRCTSWGFFGREDRQGPQALGGAYYNFPGGHDHSGAVVAAGTQENCPDPSCPPSGVGGSWYWMRSPEQERVVVTAIYNRYCVRCHGIDGRGVWDIPGVPDFTNTRWQATRGDDQIARIIVEGRGAVMPAFRGTMTLEEAWAMARYLRRFVPGTEVSRPVVDGPKKAAEMGPVPAAKAE
jgi:cytochrome c5